jgi:hypothetical protein
MLSPLHSMIFKSGMAAFLCMASSGSALACPLLKATYTSLNKQEDMSVSAGRPHRDYEITHISKKIAHNQSDIVLRISEKQQKLSYDFGYAFTLGYGSTVLIFAGASAKSAYYEAKNKDPHSTIFYFDKDLKTVSPEKDDTKEAPVYLIMPELGASFWYWEPGLKNFIPPAGMWKQSGCKI